MKNLKKKNNKGFSLVELIVAVAIMAVLMGVLIPTLIRYVEKSKKQKDESAVEEMRYQIELVMAGNADWSAYEGTITFKGSEINFASPTSKSFTDAQYKAFMTEASINLGEPETSETPTYKFKFSSKHADADTETTFTIKDGKVYAVIDSGHEKYGTVTIPEGATVPSVAAPSAE